MRSEFQSTHSLRSATADGRGLGGSRTVSIHALLAECDGNTNADSKPEKRFQSTHSLRSATSPTAKTRTIHPVSIHALLAECDYSATDRLPLWPVSIHALLAECDLPICRMSASTTGFNPRTPCGVRQWPGACADSCRRFQSTHSLRSATLMSLGSAFIITVSIHALLAECDRKRKCGDCA